MNRILLVCLVALFPIFLFAQNAEIGLQFGASGYSGDITPSTKYLSTGDNHASLGILEE